MAKVRLDSWKSIAEYLKRSPRTVQRWHAEFGLPVHHFGGGKGPVFSYADELDGWLSGFVEESGEGSASAEESLAARRRRSSELTALADELWELRNEHNLGTIATLYRNAVDQNPLNAPAFTGIANSIVLSVVMGTLRGSAAYPRAVEALNRALRLGSESSDTRCAAAWLQLVQERKWKRAREGFEEVLDREPHSSHAMAGRALLHVAEGNLDSAARDLHDAWTQNTLASALSTLLCWVQYLSGDSEQALESLEQLKSSGDAGAVSAAVEAFALIQSGPVAPKLKQIESMAGAHPRSLVLQGALGFAYAVSDRARRAREVLHNLNRTKGDSLYPIALVLLGLGEKHQAIFFLEASYAEGSLWSLGFRSDPILRSSRVDSRFEARLRKLGPPT